MTRGVKPRAPRREEVAGTWPGYPVDSKPTEGVGVNRQSTTLAGCISGAHGLIAVRFPPLPHLWRSAVRLRSGRAIRQRFQSAPSRSGQGRPYEPSRSTPLGTAAAYEAILALQSEVVSETPEAGPVASLPAPRPSVCFVPSPRGPDTAGTLEGLSLARRAGLCDYDPVRSR